MCRSILSLVVCIAYIYGGDAFILSRSGVVVVTRTAQDTTNNNSLQINKRYSTCIALKEDDEEDNVVDEIIDKEELVDTKKGANKDDEPTEATKIYRKIRNVIFLPFSYTLQFLGFFFFCGLLLNFAGYAYTFDFNNGLVIDKIDNVRNEMQFEREIVREEKEELKEAAEGYRGSMSGAKDLVIPDVPEGL